MTGEGGGQLASSTSMNGLDRAPFLGRHDFPGDGRNMAAP